MLFFYPAIIKNDGISFKAEFPDLQGSIIKGKSLNEVLYKSKEFLEFYIFEQLENKRSLPEASDINELSYDDMFISTLVQVDIDLNKSSKSIKKTLTIPSWLNERAMSKGINFSRVLQEALVEKIKN